MDHSPIVNGDDPAALRLPDAATARRIRTVVFDYHRTLTQDLDAPAHGEAPVTARAARACRQLAGAGYRLILATNTRPDEPREGELATAGIRRHFAALVLSHLLDAGKPEPAFYEHVFIAARAAAEEILWVGDRMSHDILPPAALGMHTALIRPHGPRRGDHQRLPARGHILEHVDQVPALLDRLNARRRDHIGPGGDQA